MQTPKGRTHRWNDAIIAVENYVAYCPLNLCAVDLPMGLEVATPFVWPRTRRLGLGLRQGDAHLGGRCT